MSHLLKKIKVILGIALCVVGVAGMLLPVVPGVPIILAGFALIGSDHPIVRNLKEWIERWRGRRKQQGP